MDFTTHSDNPLLELARENLINSLNLLKAETDKNRIGSSLWNMAKTIALASIEFLETETDMRWVYTEKPKDGV